MSEIKFAKVGLLIEFAAMAADSGGRRRKNGKNRKRRTFAAYSIAGSDNTGLSVCSFCPPNRRLNDIQEGWARSIDGPGSHLEHFDLPFFPCLAIGWRKAMKFVHCMTIFLPEGWKGEA